LSGCRIDPVLQVRPCTPVTERPRVQRDERPLVEQRAARIAEAHARRDLEEPIGEGVVLGDRGHVAIAAKCRRKRTIAFGDATLSAMAGGQDQGGRVRGGGRETETPPSAFFRGRTAVCCRSMGCGNLRPCSSAAIADSGASSVCYGSTTIVNAPPVTCGLTNRQTHLCANLAVQGPPRRQRVRCSNHLSLKLLDAGRRARRGRHVDRSSLRVGTWTGCPSRGASSHYARPS
jgi:hypothetical protein